MQTKKFLATAAIGVGLVAGSVGIATVLPSGVAGAQTSTSSATANRPHARRHLRREEFKVAADTIGVPPAELLSDLKAGQSVADVANAKGVPVETVVNAIVQDASQRVDQAVTNGKLTQEQADKIKAALPARVDKAVNHHRTAH